MITPQRMSEQLRLSKENAYMKFCIVQLIEELKSSGEAKVIRDYLIDVIDVVYGNIIEDNKRLACANGVNLDDDGNVPITSTGLKNSSVKVIKDADQITGYDKTKTQILKNVSVTSQWISE